MTAQPTPITDHNPHPSPPRDGPTVLKCKSTADFLAALPFVTGYTAENSIFIVLFRGSRAGNVLRFDLPPEERHDDGAPLIDAIEGILDDTGAGQASPAIVLTTSERFSDRRRAPRLRFARRIQRRFRARGWTLRELAVIAADGWSGLLDQTDPAPRALSEIVQAQRAVEARTTRAVPASLSVLGEIPAADPARAAAVAAKLWELAGHANSGHANGGRASERTATHEWLPGVARVAETCFERAGDLRSNAASPGVHRAGADRVDPRVLARLIDATTRPDRWLALALTAVTRARFVISLIDDFDEDPLTGVAVHESENSTGWSLRNVLLLLSQEPVEPHKLARAITALEDAAAHAPETRRVGVLAMLAWLWWLRGLQSVAHRLITQALDHEPGDSEAHAIAHLISELIEEPPAAHVLQLQEQFSAAA